MRSTAVPLLLLASCGRYAFDDRRLDGDATPAADSSRDGASAASDGPGPATDGPGAAFGSPCFALSDNLTYLDPYTTGSTGTLEAIKIVPPTALHVTRLEVFTGEVVAASAIGLWSDDTTNDRPLANLGTTAFQIALPDGWQGPDLPAPIDVAGGAPIWLVWTLVLGAQVSIEANVVLPSNPEERGSVNAGATWDGPFTDYPFKLRLWCNGAHP